MMGQRGQYANAKVPEQKERVANGYYISHTEVAKVERKMVMFSPLQLMVSTAYSGDAEVLSGQKFNIVNVANYGSGIQISGAKQRCGYITICGHKEDYEHQSYLPQVKMVSDQLVLYAGAAAIPKL